MPSVTNYLKNIKNMRLFFRSLAMGLHTRHTAPKWGIKKSLHDDYLKRLSYFNMESKIKDTQIGRKHVQTIEKQDFFWGHNYLSNLYALYAMKPETIILILAIIDMIGRKTTCTIIELYDHINDDPYVLPAYQAFLEEKNKNSNKLVPDIIDKQMIGRLTKKLVKIGVLEEISECSTYTYRLASTGIEQCTPEQLELLSRAIFMYKNMALFRTAGHTLLEKIQALVNDTSLLDELEQPLSAIYESQYVFTYTNPLHVIDESILYTIADALRNNKMIELTFYNKRRPKITVRPIRIESDYLGNRDYLIASRHCTLGSYRIDTINTVTIKGPVNTDLTIPTATTRFNTILHMRFHKLINYERSWASFKTMFSHMTMTLEDKSPYYTDITMHVQDGQILMPILRTYLPYLQILHSIPESISTRFNDNLRYTQHDTVSEPNSYSKKRHPAWSLLSPEPIESDTTISPLLNEVTAITYSTQYRIQRDLANGISYTLDDLRYIMEHRPLLNSYAPIEENDHYYYILPSYLVRSEAHGLEPLFPNLPLLITTTAERMFLKDLLNDSRINWMIPDIIRQQLAHALHDVPTTLPEHTWSNRSLAIDETATTYDTHRLCTEAIINKTMISWRIENDTIIVVPCKLEYNGATNGFALIGYHIDDKTFGYYPLHTLPTISIDNKSFDFDTDTLYREYQESNQRTAIFSVYDINNAIDRCFNAFSNYDIVGSEIEEKAFTLTVSYLPFQESDIIRILLSLGAAVRVHEPQEIKQQLNTIYKQAISFLEN